MTLDPTSRELLLATAERPPHTPAGHIAQLAATIQDWDALLAAAQEHRLVPMLFSRLTEAQAAVPAAIEERLRAEYQRNLVCSFANAAELIAVLREFESAGIRALPFKGAVLAASAYGNLTTRPAGDIDLLIGFRDLRAATAILIARGYQLMTAVHADGSPAVPDYYEYHFERAADGTVLELRWRLELTQPRYRRDLGMDWAWPGHRTVTLAGASVPEMRPEVALLALAMHGSKHLWSRLIWICDIAQVLAASPGLNWPWVIREARRTGLSRALALGVLLAHGFAGALIPEPVLRRFQADRTAVALAQHFTANLFDAPGTPPSGRVPYSLQLLDLRDRLRYLLSSGSRRPNERDRTFLPLPKALHGLYVVIRPIRILLDRSAR